MSGIINTGSYANRYLLGVNTWFGAKYTSYAPEYVDLFDVATSDRLYELTVNMVDMGLADILGDGEEIHFDTAKQGYTKKYDHINYAKGFVISELAIADDQYAPGLVQTHSEYMANSLRQTVETVAANVLNNAFASPDAAQGGDNVALIATNHPLGAGGTGSNLAASDLSELALEQAVIDIADFRTEAGLRAKILPVFLAHSTSDIFNAQRFLEGKERPGTADREISALNRTGLIPDHKVFHYLTDSDAWFVKTDCMNGLRMFERAEMPITSDNDFKTSNVMFKVSKRFSVGYDNWRGIYGSAGV